MLLTINYQGQNAEDLGYLLFKHPAKLYQTQLSYGTASVFYPVQEPESFTAALMIDIDPIALMKRAKPGSLTTVAHYVNDRPYVSSSLLSAAIAKAFGTAMTGRSEARPDIAAAELDLTLTLPVVRSAGGSELIDKLFTPLGWQTSVQEIPLDQSFPQWGKSPYWQLTLSGRQTLSAALKQLYVLLPVLDDHKHYWVGSDEISKLMRNAREWLADHPERELITQRYLVYQREYITEAEQQLDETSGAAETAETPAPPHRQRLREQRAEAVLAAVEQLPGNSIVDLGCGEGRLLSQLQRQARFSRLMGSDVSASELKRAERRLGLDEEAGERKRSRIQLIQSALNYADPRLQGFDIAVLMEVIEHIDLERLAEAVENVFGFATPGAVIVTTPNADYNRVYGLEDGEFRHDDHRFEFSRSEFRTWAENLARQYGYRVSFSGVGEEHREFGHATQVAVFVREAA